MTDMKYRMVKGVLIETFEEAQVLCPKCKEPMGRNHKCPPQTSQKKEPSPKKPAPGTHALTPKWETVGI